MTSIVFKGVGSTTNQFLVFQTDLRFFFGGGVDLILGRETFGTNFGKQKHKGKSRTPILGLIFGDPLWGKLRKSDRSFLYVLEHLAFSFVEPATVFFFRCVHQRNLHLINKASWENGSKNIDVSKNRGTPKWMVYNGKTYQNILKLMIWGENSLFGEIPIYLSSPINFRGTQISTCPRPKPIKDIRTSQSQRGQVCLCAIHLGQGYWLASTGGWLPKGKVEGFMTNVRDEFLQYRFIFCLRHWFSKHDIARSYAPAFGLSVNTLTSLFGKIQPGSFRSLDDRSLRNMRGSHVCRLQVDWIQMALLLLMVQNPKANHLGYIDLRKIMG